MISVIIPTLNEERYIGRLLQSLKRQTSKSFEVIVVDANSDDSTADIAKSYGARVFETRRNVSHQRNYGMEKAKYANKVFLDADTQVPADLIEKVDLVFSKGYDYGTARYHIVGGGIYDRLFFRIINAHLFLTQKIWPCALGSCIFTNQNIRFNENISFASDIDLVKRCTGRFCIMDEKVYVSARRFIKDGTRRTIKNWLKAYFLNFTKEGLLKADIEYEFGTYKSTKEDMAFSA